MKHISRYTYKSAVLPETLPRKPQFKHIAQPHDDDGFYVSLPLLRHAFRMQLTCHFSSALLTYRHTRTFPIATANKEQAERMCVGRLPVVFAGRNRRGLRGSLIVVLKMNSKFLEHRCTEGVVLWVAGLDYILFQSCVGPIHRILSRKGCLTWLPRSKTFYTWS